MNTPSPEPPICPEPSPDAPGGVKTGVPHKCPCCDGTGLTLRPPWVSGDAEGWSSASVETHPCKACVGSGLLWSQNEWRTEPATPTTADEAIAHLHDSECARMRERDEAAAKIADLKRAVAGLEAERAANVSPAEANELQDVLRTLVPSGHAFIWSARDLVKLMELQRADITRLTAQLAEVTTHWRELDEAPLPSPAVEEIDPMADEKAAFKKFVSTSDDIGGSVKTVCREWQAEREAHKAGKRIEHRATYPGGETTGWHTCRVPLWSDDPRDEYRIHPDDDAPKWQAEREAFARGEVIQWRHKLNDKGPWSDCDFEGPNLPSWQEFNDYRVKPAPESVAWSLPKPPPNREWHRNDGWTQEMLPDGWRPVMQDEMADMVHDEVYWPESQRWTNDAQPTPRTRMHLHTRTRRPIPAPEPERVALEACDVPPLSALRDRDGNWHVVTKYKRTWFYADGHECPLTLPTMFRDGWQIKRPGEDWQPCSKPKP